MTSDSRVSGGVITEVTGVAPALLADDPILGGWRVVETKDEAPSGRTRQRYGGRALRFEDFAEWRFAAEGRGLRSTAVPAGAGEERQPAVSCFSTLDGRPWADPYGPAHLGQLVQQWRLDAHLLLRLVLDNVLPPERLRWTLLEIGAGGGEMTATSWDDGRPDATTVVSLVRDGAPRAATVGPGEWRIDEGLTVRRSPGDVGLGRVVRDVTPSGGRTAGGA